MSLWLGVGIGAVALLVGIAVGFLGKKLIASGKLIVTEQGGRQDIFLELDDEGAISEKWVLLQVKRQKIPGR